MFSKLRDKLRSFLGKSKEEEKPKKIEKIIKEKPKKEEKAIKKPEKIKVEEKKPSFISKFTKKLISSTSTLTQKHVDEILEPLELILLENNVALEVVDKIRDNLSKDLVGLEVKKGQIEQTIINSLKESIESVLIEPPNLSEKNKIKTNSLHYNLLRYKRIW